MTITTHRSGNDSGRRQLESALLLNGTFSGVCGYGFMMFAKQINAWTGFERYVDEWAVFAVGGMLAVYALLLFVLAMRPKIHALAVMAAVVLDAGWVIGTLPLLLLPQATVAGMALVVVVAIVVGGFGVAQRKALRAYDPDADREMTDSLRGGDFGRIGRSWLGMKTWIKIWLFGLNAIFIVGLAFLDRGHLAQWILLAYVASGPYLFAFMIAQKGLSRVLGVAHIVPWTALLAYLLIHLSVDSALGPRADFNRDFAYAAYLASLAAATAFCLGFDYYDFYRWLRGERYLLGSEEAAKAGASKLMFV